MKRHHTFLQTVTLLLVVMLFANGCTMTRELWNDREFHARTRADLQIAVSPERPVLLVEYTEQFERSKHTARRAFFIDLEDRYEPYVKPVFINPKDHPGMTPVRVLAATSGTNSITSQGYVAVETPNVIGFDLWRDGQKIGRYPLPSYTDDAPVTPETVAKTPLTMLVDGVKIVVVVAIVVAVLAAYSHADSSP